MVEDANLETAPRIGAEMIRFEAARAPAGPGVYRMLNDAGEVLYVGKAKSIKKRVLQYAQGRAHSNRIALMVSLARAMEFVSTATETEALLLEANLIKTLKPRFNILLRDDKSFAELLIRKDHEAPQILKHRGARRMKGAYFGPFASTWAVNHALATLQRAFLLRTCSDSTYESRTRPCLLYQIKRCSAPCTGVIGLEEYGALAAQAESFLKGRSRAVIEELSGLMQAASDDLDFEKAAVYRDRIRALSSVSSSQTINPKTVDEADVFALHLEGGQACVQVFFFRAGQNWGTRAYFPRVDVSDPPGEILSAFLAQFYQDRPPPRLILTSSPPSELELLTEALSLKAERKVEIATPQRGEKLELVEHAGTNAREALGRRLSESSAQSKLLAMTAEIFGLETPPQRIEVYDNSHIQGTNAVGAFIVAGPEGFEKSQYRKFNFKPGEVPPGDDYAMMRKVLMRRFSRMLTDEADGGTPPRPDLLLIDGGAGQLEMALEALRELGLEGEIAVVGVAKGPDRDAGLERFFMPGKAPFMLPPKSAALYYLQRLRDEAHRFAIGAHRTRRAIDMTKSPLDEIDGVGPRRKKALLHAFGSARDVAGASLADLAKVEGVNDALAQRIFDFFNPQP